MDSWVRTGPGVKYELSCADGSTVRINEQTEIHMTAPYHPNLTKGEQLTHIATAVDHFLIHTLEATIEATDTTLYVRRHENVDGEPGRTTLTVVSGSARMAAQHVQSGYGCIAKATQIGSLRTVRDLMLSTNWVNELPAARPETQGELQGRMNQILACSGKSKSTCFMNRKSVPSGITVPRDCDAFHRIGQTR